MAFRNEEYRHNFGQINCLDQMITPLFDYPPKISGKARALIDLAAHEIQHAPTGTIPVVRRKFVPAKGGLKDTGQYEIRYIIPGPFRY